MRVLIVEDDPVLHGMIMGSLEGLGHDVLGATSLDEARAAARSHLPEWLITDEGLPDGSGRGLIEELTARPESAIVQSVLITGDVFEGSSNSDYPVLLKPFRLSKLVTLLQGADLTS